MVSVPVVRVNGISSVTSTDPSMMILSEPIGSTSSLQLNRSDQFNPSPPPSHEIVQVSTGWVPETEPIITPLQSLFIVPLLLSMVPDVMSMVPELLMMLPLLMKMPLPPEFDIVMSPELLMVPPEKLLMPLPMPVF